jgi:hypothetical protein
LSAQHFNIMTLAEIATVSGKGGLFKVVAPTKSGVILESLDEAKTKMIATTNHRLSLLNEISIYTTTKEGTVALDAIIKKIHKDFGNDIGINANADPAELKSFLKSILPEYDEDRVYVSDIKKLVKWYEIMLKYTPEVFTEEEKKEEPKKEEAPKEAKETKAATKEAPAPKKAPAKKAKKE